MTVTASLKLLDDQMSRGRTTLTTRDVQRQLAVSPQSASNMLTRLQRAGLVDRVARGHYAIRQLGLLGTRAATEDPALAVGALLAQEPHRIAYRSALDHHGLLTHPARTIQVACPRHVAVERLSGRPLRIVRERLDKIRVGMQPAGHGACISGLERALVDAAARPDLVGGYETVAAALFQSDGPVAGSIVEIARQLGAAPALRRLGSLADRLALPGLAGELTPLRPPTSDIDMEPGLEPLDGEGFRDKTWQVRWPTSPDRLADALRQ